MALNLEDNKNNYFPALGLNATLEEIQDYINSLESTITDLNSELEIVENNLIKREVTFLSPAEVLQLGNTHYITTETPQGYYRMIEHVLISNIYGTTPYEIVGNFYVGTSDVTSIMGFMLEALKYQGVRYLTDLGVTYGTFDRVLQEGDRLQIVADQNPTVGDSTLIFIVLFRDLPLSELI